MYNWCIQEFDSKTFRAYGHAKNIWTQHIEQTELCYTEKSPTVKYRPLWSWFIQLCMCTFDCLNNWDENAYFILYKQGKQTMPTHRDPPTYFCSQFTIFVKMGVLVLHFVSLSVRQCVSPSVRHTHLKIATILFYESHDSLIIIK